MDTCINKKIKLYPSISENFTYLSSFFGDGIGLILSRNKIFKNQMQMGIAYIDSITDSVTLRDHVLYPLLHSKSEPGDNPDKVLQFIRSRVLSVTNLNTADDLTQIIKLVLSGYTVLFIENAQSALVIENRKVEKKAVESPENETTILGSQESFTDDIKTNTSLLIKRLPVPGLHFEEYTVGKQSQTKLKLAWMNEIADANIIAEAKRRIQKIDIDNIYGIGALAELIEDRPMSVFPKYRQTERPDLAAKSLTDGRFIILLDNSPFVMIAPIMFWDNFRTMDDYEEKSIIGSYLRIIRYISFMLSTLLSALYLSFVTYNQSIVPTSLALNIAAGREGVPFPTVIELLLLSIAITIIREAGLRMSSSVTYFVGTLSAIIIGQAVVTAGYISASLIIVIAVSTIASFAISATTLLYPARMLNYFFIVLAGFFGMFGVINGLVLVFWHLTTLNSFGVPYLYPVLPFDKNDFKDALIRSPYKNLKMRMKRLAPRNLIKAGGISQNKEQ